MKTFKIRVDDAKLNELKNVVTKRLLNRNMTESDNAEFILQVIIDPDMKADSFRITGKYESVVVTADSLINAYAGCGRFLYLSRFGKDGIVPTKQRGLTTFDCVYRCVYAASHYHTFYYIAPIEKVCTYIEDLALMGINVLCHPIPSINLNINNKEEMGEAFDRCAEICKKAMSLGMKINTSGYTSITFLDIPENAKATPIPDPIPCRGNSGKKACPSKPEGQHILDETNRFVMNEWKKRGVKIDTVGSFPYDEGGCGCPDCHPWGARGYLKACKRAKEVIKEFYPECKFIISTWLFDKQVEGEWEALSKSLENEKWLDFIEADSHDDYPRYPLDVKIPGNLPLVAFPEISMWGLWPWGGYGASFFPKRYTDIWRSTEGKLSGGRMYSEGIFEDLNKYTVSGLYRDYNNNPDDAVAEYGAYEFGCQNIDDFVEMVDCIEKNTVLNSDSPGKKVFMTADINKSDITLAERAWELAQKIDSELPGWGKSSWRWRLMYIRAYLDLQRYNNKILHEVPEALELMNELMDIYHCIKDYKIDTDPFHIKLRPPIPVYDEFFDADKYQTIGSILNAASIGLIRTPRTIDIKADASGNQA